MNAHETWPPDVLPVLSRGKHRNPRKGACFMELVSYLAGEKWSDRPTCTHALLGALAREVNDRVGDDARRTRLGQLVPGVIGLTSHDPRVDAWIALRAARTALPVIAEERQRVMAVAILRCERVLASLEGRPADEVSESSRQVLEQVPHATTWARQFMKKGHKYSVSFSDRLAPWIVYYACEGIAKACVIDPDDMLCGLLEETVAECATWMRPAGAASTVDGERWQEACRLTGVSSS